MQPVLTFLHFATITDTYAHIQQLVQSNPFLRDSMGVAQKGVRVKKVRVILSFSRKKSSRYFELFA